MVAFKYGPIVVTAVAEGQWFEVRCPACQQRFRIQRSVLGAEITCAHPGCGTRLRVNPFVIEQPMQRKSNWLSRLLKK
jgi:hypothetical protein